MNQAVSDINNRQGAQFKVSLGKNNTLQIAGKVDVSKLSKGEQALYNAVTDSNHVGTLATVSQHPEVHFGVFASGGINVLDSSDVSLARGVSRELAAEIVTHEALEAYRGSLGESYDKAHQFTNQFFGRHSWPRQGGVDDPVWNFGNNTYRINWQFQRPSMMIETTFRPFTAPPGYRLRFPNSRFPVGTMTGVRRVSP